MGVGESVLTGASFTGFQDGASLRSDAPFGVHRSDAHAAGSCARTQQPRSARAPHRMGFALPAWVRHYGRVRLRAAREPRGMAEIQPERVLSDLRTLATFGAYKS